MRSWARLQEESSNRQGQTHLGTAIPVRNPRATPKDWACGQVSKAKHCRQV